MRDEFDPRHPQLLKELNQVYARRFPPSVADQKSQIWRRIAAYMQRFVDPAGAVLDLACDRGDFIRSIRAAEKWATDIREVRSSLPPGVRFVQADGLSLAALLPSDHFDAIFMSNYLEHLPSSNAVIQQLEVCYRLLKRGGLVIILQPNIRLIRERYWDFIDHKVALTDRSLVEATGLAGFETVQLIKRFLPYTTKNRLPQSPALVSFYLRVRPAWLVMGKQTLYVGAKR